MRLQFNSMAVYERRRSIAVGSERDADFDLVDADGTVLLSYRQRITWERDTTAYDDACNPPIDDCMERIEQRPRAATVKPREPVKPSRSPWRFRPTPAYDRPRKYVHPKGEPLQVSYKPTERPRGTVEIW